ncbi:MAG: aldo/keto reductase, partial [Firmicutes bacterium]|nr:aldo/keto reductase [Bacillota bacterium]
GIVTNASDFALKERLRFWFGNKDLAMDRYRKLEIKADRCTSCQECMSKCPYGIDIIRKLSICDYKLAGKDIY